MSIRIGPGFQVRTQNQPSKLHISTARLMSYYPSITQQCQWQENSKASQDQGVTKMTEGFDHRNAIMHDEGSNKNATAASMLDDGKKAGKDSSLQPNETCEAFGKHNPNEESATLSQSVWNMLKETVNTYSATPMLRDAFSVFGLGSDSVSGASKPDGQSIDLEPAEGLSGTEPGTSGDLRTEAAVEPNKASEDFNKNAADVVQEIYNGEISDKALQDAVYAIAKADGKEGVERLATLINKKAALAGFDISAEIIQLPKSPEKATLLVSENFNDGNTQTLNFHYADFSLERK